MREVQLAMLAQPETAHPYFWAAFVVSGAPTPLDEPGAGSAPTSGDGGDKKSAASEAGKVTPGARGCACEIEGAREAGPLGGLALLAAAWAASRRRGAQRASRLRAEIDRPVERRRLHRPEAR